MAARQSVAEFKGVGSSSSTAQFALIDIPIPSIDGLSYATAGVSIMYTVTANAGGSGVQTIVLVTAGALVSGALTMSPVSSVVSVGAAVISAYAESVTGGNTARLSITPAVTAATSYLVHAEVQLYDPT